MPSLTKNREVFNSVANADVVSSNAPNGDVGVGKTVGEKGFFIKTNTTFTLWFKDGSGVWSVSNNNATTGTYEWGANQSFYIQSDSNANFFVFKRKVTPAPRANVMRANKTARNRTFDTATSHTNVASSWTTSGHTGEAFSVGMFDSEGAGDYLSAPLSGQREGKILGYDENGDMGWIIPPTVTVDVMGETDGIENEANLNGGAYFTNEGAVVLDGVDDYVQTDDNYHFPDQFQFEANIKPTNLDDDFQTIAGTRNFDGSANGFILQIKDGMLRATGPQSDNFVLDAPIPDDIDMEDGEYHEIKLKWIKDDELTIFLDGEPIGTHTPSGEVRGGTEDMEIGRNPKNKNMHFEGEIDGVTVTNEVQTEEEILNEFIAKILGNTPSPVDYDSIEDLQSTTMVNGASLVNGYVALNGNNYAEADSNHHYDDYLTATAWFRTVKHESGFGVLFSSRKWNGSGNGFALAIKDGGLHLHHPQTNNTHIEPTFDHVNVSDGEWHQAVLRWKANEDLSAFVDGVKVGSLVPAGVINGGVGNLLIGTEPLGFTGMFVGHIDGVKVENVYKSDNEIMAEFTKVPLISLLGNNPLGLFDAPYLDPGATAIDHPDGDLTAGITSDWNAVIGADPADGDHVVTYSVTDSDGNASTLERTVQIGDGLEDFATLANNASRPDGSLHLNGVSQYGYLPSSTDYDLDGGDMTVRCWFKTDNALGGGRGLITKGHGSAAWKGWGLYLHDANGLAFNMWSSAGGGGGNRSNLMGSPSDWNVGEWNHIALVMRTTDTWKLYVNGQLLNEFTPASITTSTDAELRIGATKIVNNNLLGHSFDGQIKKALIDKTALSAADILAEYQLGEPPEITLLGGNPYVLSSLEDADPGATADDSLDGDVTANITSNWDDVVVEDLTSGPHNVTYNVTDSDGNSKSATREIWNGTIEDWPTTTLEGDASRANGILTLGGTGYAVADRNHHYDDFFFVDFWFKTDSLQPSTNPSGWSGMVVPVSTRAWNGNYNGFTIGMSSTHLNFHVPSHNSFYTYDLDGEDINDGQWHYLGLHFSQSPFGGQITLYIDGQGKITESWVGGNPIGGSRNLNIGRDPFSGNFRFIGDINHVSIINEHINGHDVTARYLANAPAAITLLGDTPMTITSLPTTDPGATSIDPTDGDITANIVSDWDAVIGGTPSNGSYVVNYSSTDSDGNVSTITRDVEIAIAATPVASNLEESYPDGSGGLQPTVVYEDAEKVNGMHIDTRYDNGYVEGNFSDVMRPLSTDDKFTFSCFWRNHDSSAGNKWVHLFNAYGDEGTTNSTTGYRISLNQYDDDSFKIDVKQNDTSFNTGWLHGNVLAAKGQFHHFAFTSNGSEVEFYINGQSVWSSNKVFLPTAPEDGKYTIGSSEFQCAIDKVEIYDVVLNADEINQLSTENRGALDAAFGVALTDLSDTYPTVTSNDLEESCVSGPTTVMENGIMQDGMYIDTLRNNGYVQGDFHDNYRPESSMQTWSFSAFYRLDELNAAGQFSLFNARNGNKGYHIWVYQNTGDNLQIKVDYQGTSNWIAYSNGNLNKENFGEFHHVAFTYSDSTMKLYFNGALVGTYGSKAFSPEAPDNGEYTIGGQSMKVVIDKVAIYKGTLLSDADVLALANTRTDLEAAYDTAVANFQASLPAPVVSPNLQDVYKDSNGVEQNTIAREYAVKVNGSLVDTWPNNGYAEGDFSDDLKPVNVLDPFSFIAGFRVNEGHDTTARNVDIFNCRSGNQGWKLRVYRGNSNNMQIAIDCNATTNHVHWQMNDLSVSGLDCDAEKYHSVGFTAYNGEIKLYYDGNLIGTYAKTFLPDTPTDGKYYVGENQMVAVYTHMIAWRGELLDDAQMASRANSISSYDVSHDLNVTNPYLASLSNVTTTDLISTGTVNGNGLKSGETYEDLERGTDHYLSGDWSSDLVPDSGIQPFSFSAFYKIDPSEEDARHWVEPFSAWEGNSGWRILLYKQSATRMQYRIGNGTSGSDWIHHGNLENKHNAAGEWNHIAFTSQNGIVKTYLNGELLQTWTNKWFLPSAPSNNLYKIGSHTIKCTVADVKIYKGQLLTGAEITTLSDNTPPKPPPSINYPDSQFDGSSLTASDGRALSTSDNGVVSTDSVAFNGQNVLDFSNSAQEVNVSPAYDLNGVYSFSHWFKDMPSGNFNTFARDAGGESVLQVHNQNLRMRQGGSNYYGPSMAAYKELNSWTHLVVVADGSESKVYINGVLFHTFNVVSDDSIDIFGNQPWSQGQQTWANYIADLRYWDQELTAEQVLELYNASLPTEVPPLEEDAVLINGATYSDGVLTFDNSSTSYATLPHSEDLDIDQQDTTVHLWFYPTSTTFTNGHTQVLLGKHYNGSPSYEGYQIAYGDRKHPTVGTPGETGIKVFSCAGACGGATHNTIFRVAGGVPLNQWNHVAISYNTSNNVHTCYFNGQPIGTWTQVIPNGTPQDLAIGGTGSQHRSLDGKIRGITFENSVLSDAEILEIYNASLLPDAYFDGSSLNSQIGNYAMTINAGSAQASGGKYSATFDTSAANTDMVMNSSWDMTDGNSLTFWVKEIIAEGDKSPDYWWRFVGQNGATSGPTNSAIFFDSRAKDGGIPGHLGSVSNGAVNHRSATYSLNPVAGDGQWHFFAIVKDGGSLKFYEDGVLVDTIANMDSNWTVKEFNGWSNWGNGKAANYWTELAHWDRALSDEKILMLYNATDPIKE